MLHLPNGVMPVANAKVAFLANRGELTDPCNWLALGCGTGSMCTQTVGTSNSEADIASSLPARGTVVGSPARMAMAYE
jgi:hypothetical protein